MNQPVPVKCGGCKGNGVCCRCRGSGIEGKDEVIGEMIVLGPITCKRCRGNGVCPGCGGSGWVAFPRVPSEADGR